MFRRSACRLTTTRLNANKLFKEINQEPMQNWRATYSQKLSPDVEKAAEAVHKHRTACEGPEYGQLTANNFPYPLMYAMCYFVWAVVAVAGYCFDVHAPFETNNTFLEFNAKNADGTTQVPAAPRSPSPLFESMVQIRQ